MHKGVLGLLSQAAWLVTAVVALNIGTRALGIFDFYMLNVFVTNPAFRMYFDYSVGFAGAFSLFGFVKHVLYCGHGSCECC